MHTKQTHNRRSQSCYQSTDVSHYIPPVSRKTFIKIHSNKSYTKNSISLLSDLYIQNNEPIQKQQSNKFLERHTFNHEKDPISNGNSYHMRSASMPNKTLYLHKTIDVPYDLSYMTPTSISINFLACTSDQCKKKLNVQQCKNNNDWQKHVKYYSLDSQISNDQYFDGKSSINESTLDSLQINSLSLQNNNHKNRVFGQIKHQKNHKKSFCSQKQNSLISEKSKYDPTTVTQQKEIKLKLKHILLPKRAPIPQ